MSETQKYEAKEDAKSKLCDSIKEYIDAAESYGLDDFEQCREITDLFYDCGKKWGVNPE